MLKNQNLHFEYFSFQKEDLMIISCKQIFFGEKSNFFFISETFCYTHKI